MPAHYQLANFETKDSGSNFVILISGSRKYYTILRDAFNQYRFSADWGDRNNRFEWGTYIYNIEQAEREKVVKLLETFQNIVCIEDALEQTFALSYHMRPFYEGGGRTEIGEIVYNAKPYHRNPTARNRAKASELAIKLEDFISTHPSYRRSDFIIASPPSRPDKPFDVPSFLAEELCTRLKIESGQKYIRKVKPTEAMKDIRTLQGKLDNMQGAFAVNPKNPFKGHTVTIIDDIYHSGITLHELAITLQSAGARVLGLVATKTLEDID